MYIYQYIYIYIYSCLWLLERLIEAFSQLDFKNSILPVGALLMDVKRTSEIGNSLRKEQQQPPAKIVSSAPRTQVSAKRNVVSDIRVGIR
jgi:hypothetical protein